MNKKNKYFLLYLRTGGGHLAPAKAVAEYINNNYKDTSEVFLIDGFSEAGNISKFVVEDGYRILQKNAKWFYEFLYAFYHLPYIPDINDLFFVRSILPYLEKKILQEKPDKIIIFHFFLISHVYRIIKKHSLKIKVLTVVTDPFTAHPFWFTRKDQEFIIFSSRLKNSMLKKGIPENKIHIFPFLLNDKFTHQLCPDELTALKQKHNFDADKKSVLVFGGGDGIPKGLSILKNLLETHTDANIAIICGNNHALYKKATELKNRIKAENLFIYGFVDFVNELLNISDIVITKAGASATKEIISLKKVPIIINYIWGQELGNVEFIVKNKLGIYQKNINKLSAIVNRLLSDKYFYNSFVENIEKQNIQNGTPAVSDFIITY